MRFSKKIILASESPRRKKLILQLGIKNLEVVKHGINETKFTFNHPISKSVKKLSEMKATSVKDNPRYKKNIIISGDTIVIRAGKIFHKTKKMTEVNKYLKLLSNRKHFVYGGLCVISSDGKIFSRAIKTEVYFNKIEDSDITKEVLQDGLGKAGGYAIQSLGAKFVKKIRGCYTNIVGISIPELYKILKSSEI